MKKVIIMMACVVFMGVSMASAEPSTMDGNAVLNTDVKGIMLNTAAFANTEAHVGSVVLRNDASYDGNVSATVTGVNADRKSVV